eukprot:scaffold21337_cov21-Cyclotella_meneghiniana.AAC.1
MADDGYNEFLSLLAAAPSKDDAKKVVATSTKKKRSVAKKQEVTSDVEKSKDDRPKVDRMSSVTLRHGESQQESIEKDRVSGVKFHVEPQANYQHEGTITESSYNSGDKLGSFVHMTDADYNDAPTVISTNDTFSGSSLYASLTVFIAKMAVKTFFIAAYAFVQFLWVMLLVFGAWIFVTLYHVTSDWQTHHFTNGGISDYWQTTHHPLVDGVIVISDWQTQLANGVSILNILVTFGYVSYQLTL